jgi:membrane-associated phospholipid phosphatase
MRLHSPSGHVAIATTFYGGCAMILADGHKRAVRFASWLAALILVGTLAASRVLLGLHSVLEVLFGVIIGAGCLLLLGTSLAKRSISVAAGHVIVLFLLIIAARTSHVDGEAFVAHMAQKVRVIVKVAPAAAARVVQGRTDEKFDLWHAR